MKYLILLYDAPGVRTRLSADLIEQMQTLLRELRAAGELIDVQALADPTLTRTVRFDAGVPAVTDGPYAEAKEQMGGFLILDVDGDDRAAEIASRWPASVVDAIEVRPLMSEGVDPR